MGSDWLTLPILMVLTNGPMETPVCRDKSWLFLYFLYCQLVILTCTSSFSEMAVIWVFLLSQSFSFLVFLHLPTFPPSSFSVLSKLGHDRRIPDLYLQCLAFLVLVLFLGNLLLACLCFCEFLILLSFFKLKWITRGTTSFLVAVPEPQNFKPGSFSFSLKRHTPVLI